MSTPLAIFHRQDLTVSATPQVAELIDATLSVSSLIGKVETPAENEQATLALRGIKTITKAIEDARKAVKEPFLKACRDIDALAKTHSAELEAEALRVVNLQSEYAAELLRVAREAEAARAAEVAKIEADATLAPELKAQAIEATGPVAMPAKAEGQTIRERWRWEVTNIWATVSTHPGLVKVEPRAREIGECIDHLASTGATPKIPGLRIWKEVVSGVRLKAGKTVDV